MKLTPQLRARLNAARCDLASAYMIRTVGWTDDQCLSAIDLVLSGHSAQDAAAVVIGDAVLEDGKVDYDPGCAWIDSILQRRLRSAAESEDILARWEARRGPAASTTPEAGAADARRSLHLLF